MDYLNKLISKWMPEDSPRVAVDSHPRLSGIMDTINATLAHAKATRLPSEFYDSKLRNIIQKIAVEEWFDGYQESREYRMVGIGGLVGDVVSRMVDNVEQNGNDGLLEIGGESSSIGTGRGGEKRIKLAMSGCHDTTLAGFLSGFGAFKGETWPPFTSHIALELFRQRKRAPDVALPVKERSPDVAVQGVPSPRSTSWLSSIFASSQKAATLASSAPVGIGRKPSSALSAQEKKSLEGYYVRMRYNDRPVTIPGCKAQGNHLAGDESFCTLVSSAGMTPPAYSYS